MRVNLLPTVRIGPFDFKVIQDNCLESTDRIAEIDYVHLEIHVLETIAEAKKEESLLHEIIHGILWYSGLSNKGNELPARDEEQFVRPFSIGLRQVIRDNPGLFIEEE